MVKSNYFIFNFIFSFEHKSLFENFLAHELINHLPKVFIEKFDSMNNDKPWVYYLHLNDIHGQAIFHKDFVHDNFNDKKLGQNQYERMVSLMDPWIKLQQVEVIQDWPYSLKLSQ